MELDLQDLDKNQQSRNQKTVSTVEQAKKALFESIQSFAETSVGRKIALKSPTAEQFLVDFHVYMQNNRSNDWIWKFQMAVATKLNIEPEFVTMDELVQELSDESLSAKTVLLDYATHYVEDIQNKEAQRITYIQRRDKIFDNIPEDIQKKLFEQNLDLKLNFYDGYEEGNPQINIDRSFATLISTLFVGLERSGLDDELVLSIKNNILDTKITLGELDNALVTHYGTHISQNLRGNIKDKIDDVEYVRKQLITTNLAFANHSVVEKLAEQDEETRRVSSSLALHGFGQQLMKEFPYIKFWKSMKVTQRNALVEQEDRFAAKAYIYYVWKELAGSADERKQGLSLYLKGLWDSDLDISKLSTQAKQGFLDRELGAIIDDSGVYYDELIESFAGNLPLEKLQKTSLSSEYQEILKSIYTLEKGSTYLTLPGIDGVQLEISQQDLSFRKEKIHEVGDIGKSCQFSSRMSLKFDENKVRKRNEKEGITNVFQTVFGLQSHEKSTAYIHNSSDTAHPNNTETSIHHLQQFMMFGIANKFKKPKELFEDSAIYGKVYGASHHDLEQRHDEEIVQSNIDTLFAKVTNKKDTAGEGVTEMGSEKASGVEALFLKTQLVSFADFIVEKQSEALKAGKYNEIKSLNYLQARQNKLETTGGLPGWNRKGQTYIQPGYFEKQFDVTFDQESKCLSIGERTLTRDHQRILWIAASRGEKTLDTIDQLLLKESGYDMSYIASDIQKLSDVRTEYKSIGKHEAMHTYLQVHGFSYEDMGVDQIFYGEDINDIEKQKLQAYLNRLGVSGDVLMMSTYTGAVGLTHELLCTIAEGRLLGSDADISVDEAHLSPYIIVSQTESQVVIKSRSLSDDPDFVAQTYTIALSSIEAAIQTYIVNPDAEEVHNRSRFSFNKVKNLVEKIGNERKLGDGRQVDSSQLDYLIAARGAATYGTGAGLDSATAQGLSLNDIGARYLIYSHQNAPHTSETNYATAIKSILDAGQFDSFEAKANELYDRFHTKREALGLTSSSYATDRTRANRHIGKTKYISDNRTTGENYSTNPQYTRYTSYVGDPLSSNAAIDDFAINTMLGRLGVDNLNNITLDQAQRDRVEAIVNGRVVNDLSSLELANIGAILNTAATQNPSQPTTSTTPSGLENNPDATLANIKTYRNGEGPYNTNPDEAHNHIDRNKKEKYLIDSSGTKFTRIGRSGESYPNKVLDVADLGSDPSNEEINDFISNLETEANNGPNGDGYTLSLPEYPKDEINLGSSFTDPSKRKYLRDQLDAMKKRINDPYADAISKRKHQLDKEKVAREKENSEKRAAEDAEENKRKQEQLEEDNMLASMKDRFSRLGGDSSVGYDQNTTKILVSLKGKTLTPGRSGIGSEFAEFSMNIDSQGKLILTLDDSTFDTIRGSYGSTIQLDTPKEWNERYGRQKGVFRMRKNMNRGDFSRYINSSTDHNGNVFESGLAPWTDGESFKIKSNGKIVKEVLGSEGKTEEPITLIGNITEIEDNISGKDMKKGKKENLLQKVDWQDDGVIVSAYHGRWSKKMSYEGFSAYVAGHGFRPYTQVELEKSDSPVDQTTDGTEVGFWSKLTSIGSAIDAFKRIKEFYTDDYFKRRQDIDKARMLNFITSGFSDGAGFGIGELKAKAKADLDGANWSQIQKFKDSLSGRGGGDEGEAHGALISSLIVGQVFDTFSNSLEFKHKAAGYLMYAIDGSPKSDPYFRKLAPFDGKGAWVKALFGPEKQTVFLAQQKRMYELLKANGSIGDKEREEMLVKGEMRFIQKYASKPSGEAIRGSKFHRKVEGFADNYSESNEMSGIANSQLSKGTPEKIYETTFGPGAIGNNSPKLILGSLSAMEQLTDTPSDYSTVYQSVIASMVSGMVSFKFDKSAMDSFKGICRKTVIPIGMLAGDTNHIEQVFSLLDFAGNSSFTKAVSKKMGMGESGRDSSMLTPDTWRDMYPKNAKEGDQKTLSYLIIKVLEDRWVDNGQMVMDALNMKANADGDNDNKTNKILNGLGGTNITDKTRGHLNAYIENGVFNDYKATNGEGGAKDGDSPFYTNGLFNMNGGIANSVLFGGINNGRITDFRVRDAWGELEKTGESFQELLGSDIPQSAKDNLLRFISRRFFDLISKSPLGNSIEKIKDKIKNGKRYQVKIRNSSRDEIGYQNIMIDTLGYRGNISQGQQGPIPDDEKLDKSVIDALEVFCEIFEDYVATNDNAASILSD